MIFTHVGVKSAVPLLLLEYPIYKDSNTANTSSSELGAIAKFQPRAQIAGLEKYEMQFPCLLTSYTGMRLVIYERIPDA
jgi:hypothetical protein